MEVGEAEAQPKHRIVIILSPLPFAGKHVPKPTKATKKVLHNYSVARYVVLFVG